MAESLCCSTESITLLISYMPVQNKKFVKIRVKINEKPEKNNKIKRKHMKGNTQKKNSQLYLHLCISILLSFISSECSKILSLIIYFLLWGLPFKDCSAKNKFLVFPHLRICFTFLFVSKRHFYYIYKLSFTILSGIFQMLCHILLAPIVIQEVWYNSNLFGPKGNVPFLPISFQNFFFAFSLQQFMIVPWHGFC